MRKAWPIIALITGATIFPALARPPSFDERARIEATLRAEGFVAWGAIELDEDDWIVEGARGPESAQACDIYIDAQTYAITEEDCDP